MKTDINFILKSTWFCLYFTYLCPSFHFDFIYIAFKEEGCKTIDLTPQTKDFLERRLRANQER